MNSYELMRPFWDWSYDNPEKIKPVHISVFHFAIEHCNRMGWKKKFGFPSQMTMEAIGVKSYKTYINALNDLVEWGFIEMIERSRNQYSSNIIALVKYTKASTKALDKALPKHGSKQPQSTDQSIDSIIKQLNNKQYNLKQLNKVYDHLDNVLSKEEETEKPQTPKIDLYPFETFWNLYDKKTGKDKSEKKWYTIPESERKKIIDHIPKYKISQPEKRFRKNPLTYLNNKSWNDEIIENNGNNTRNTQKNGAATTSYNRNNTTYDY